MFVQGWRSETAVSDRSRAAEATINPPDHERTTKNGVDLVWGCKIPMRDGIRLNGTIYKPAHMKRPLPAIFTLTPYIADSVHDRAFYFARNGYLFVLVDSRGRKF